MNQTSKKIIIVGCGAQCKYALDIFSQTGRAVEAILDPVGKKAGENFEGLPIRLFDKAKFQEQLKKSRHSVIICVSDNTLKKRLFDLLGQTAEFTNAVHPAGVISSRASLGRGVIVNATAVIQPYAVIGDGVMIHAGVIIEHDCRIADFANLAPNVTLAGGVSIGEGTTIYTGAVVAPNISIGANAIVGAGSLVLNDLPDNAIAYGAPAKTVRETSP